MKVLSFLFPNKFDSNKTSFLLLVVRVVFGLFLAHHGLQKLMGFDAMASSFADPFGIGSEASLAMAIFGELVCSLGFVFGFLTRLALIPMIITMVVAIATAHGGSITEGELAFLYLVVFVLSWFAGPGKISVDALIGRKLKKD